MKNGILLINERIESNGHFLNDFGLFSFVSFGVKEGKRHAWPTMYSISHLNI